MQGLCVCAIETALKIAHGDSVTKTVYIPFRLVTRDNIRDFTGRT